MNKFNKFNKLQAYWKKYRLEFKQASGTSRGTLTYKDAWFILLKEENRPNQLAIGECGLLRGLSIDDRPDYEQKLQELCDNINDYDAWLENGLKEFPSIHFGLEMALLDLKQGSKRSLHPSDFTQNKIEIPINGLVWMGDRSFMFEQIQQKIAAGFDCIKMKIGAIDFEQEHQLLQFIRDNFPKEKIELRVDANGGFSAKEAPTVLERLAKLDIHSIEQPIGPRQWEEMKNLCKNSPLPIALDEELIGIFDKEEKEKMLDQIQPNYLIFKPSFIGGYTGTQEWIDLCEERNIGWWITSALESNIGLNAIAQWTATLNSPMHQGLGTGQLYTNNFPSPLYIKNGKLCHGNFNHDNLSHDSIKGWDLSALMDQTID